MKKLLSLALVLALMLTLGVSAFAQISGETENNQPIETSPVEGNAKWVKADANGDDLTVNGCVAENESTNDAVYAAGFAKITVSGSVTEEGEYFAVRANNGSNVTVEKDITESGGKDAIYTNKDGKVVVGGNISESDAGSAIQAYNGSIVEVTGDVTEYDGGNAIYANGASPQTGAPATVTVRGNVTEEGDGDAIYAQNGATVIVYGSVEEKGKGSAISTGTGSGATVIVGGDVTEEGEGKSIAVSANNATVIIEGTVNVHGYVGALNSGEVYLGKLVGDITKGTENNVHYLIGVAPEGSAALSAVTLVSDIVANGTIDGVNEKGYKYTTTADTTALNGKTITLKPADGKILTVSGFDGANVTYVANEDGTVTFTLGNEFKGGLQNLVLKLVEIPTPGPDPTPIYYVVPVGTVTTASITLPDGIEEGLIKVLDSADHAGLTIDKSLLAEGYDHNVKVTRDNEELPEGAYRFVINWDGSLSLILSTTYLKTLGDGSYDFIATVDDLVIPFTVVVAE